MIGTLTLIIAATAIGQVASEGIDIEAFERLERQIVEARAQLGRLKQLDEEAARLETEVAVARGRLADLERASARARENLEGSAPLRERLAKREERLAARERELASLQKSIEGRRTALYDREQARASAPIVVRPFGTGVGLRPHFAECTEEGLVIYEGPDHTPLRISANRLASSPDFRRFLRRVRFQTGATAIFLIRPGGVPVYDAALQEAVRQGVRNGKIPIPAGGPLDLSEVGA